MTIRINKELRRYFRPEHIYLDLLPKNVYLNGLLFVEQPQYKKHYVRIINMKEINDKRFIFLTTGSKLYIDSLRECAVDFKSGIYPRFEQSNVSSVRYKQLLRHKFIEEIFAAARVNK